jgi:hypothetical protein
MPAATAQPWPHKLWYSSAASAELAALQALRGARHNGGCRTPEGREAKRSGAAPSALLRATAALCGNSPLCELGASRVPPQRLPGSGRLDAGCGLSRGLSAKRHALMSGGGAMSVSRAHLRSAARLWRVRCNAVGIVIVVAQSP